MDPVGFQVLGRHGKLGVVVGVQRAAGNAATVIVVRGGVSESLTYVVPARFVRDVSPERRRVVLDVDLADFVPHLNDDGTVELRTPGA